MFIDTRQLQEGTVIRSSVCVIGGGVAGITLARELARMGYESCLLESGGFGPDKGTRDLYRGENVGLPYEFADGNRLRYLGGNSNGWGGWSGQWDPWDFEKRAWVPNSGWPFGREELEKFSERTHEILQLGPPNFDPQYWVQAAGKRKVQRIPLTTGNVREVVAQFSPPTRFGKVYRNDLERANSVRVLLHANATNLEVESGGSAVSSVEVKTLTGRTIHVEAQIFVLATGGIENARLLLASNSVYPAGIGNGNDLVGRFFMDNPRHASATVRFTDKKWSNNHLYDITLHGRKRSIVTAHGTRFAGQFALEEPVLREEGLLNGRVWFTSIPIGEGSAAKRALLRRKQALLRKGRPEWSFRSDIATILAHPKDSLGYGLSRVVKAQQLMTGVQMEMVLEQAPDPSSRVTLSSMKDVLGMNRVKVDWRLGDLEMRTFNRTFELVAAELSHSGAAEVVLDQPLQEWPPDLEGTWHHMGTTRMHDSPKHGVVDQNCRVHGMANLFIAGSSVFPTAGPNYPTREIVALTVRLAEHLRSELSPA